MRKIYFSILKCLEEIRDSVSEIILQKIFYTKMIRTTLELFNKDGSGNYIFSKNQQKSHMINHFLWVKNAIFVEQSVDYQDHPF